MISMLAGVGSGSSMYGKTRYVETRSQSSRLGRGGMTTGAMLTAQDIQVPSQGDLKNDTNGKSPGGRQNKEDEDHAVVPPQPSVMEDKRKQEGPYWNEHGTHLFIYILQPWLIWNEIWSQTGVGFPFEAGILCNGQDCQYSVSLISA